MKHEWRKKEKELYIPKTKPQQILIPEFNFFSIEGKGNPNSPFFSDFIGALYAFSYGIKMTLKKDPILNGYYDYTVYPLEGIWDISEKAKKEFDPSLPINKDELVFKLMIRQPNFVTKEYATKIIKQVKAKKQNPILELVKFEKNKEGNCLQMLHIGSYDDEATTFKIMEEYLENHNLKRVSKIHKEIYLSDFRKVPSEKLKTVLRFNIK
ncbi:GyrI-like domain-containing protein [uncultured Polaribacter sp.]|uniref:GyrI-like domain-containing protein n=1 Tax=uncultured Polaribacter sp. TaxID=174711 RepID=UPI0026305BC9|nr:GyrI-like domain-containing protein [uncultured Polaribacter sp.]